MNNLSGKEQKEIEQLRLADLAKGRKNTLLAVLLSGGLGLTGGISGQAIDVYTSESNATQNYTLFTSQSGPDQNSRTGLYLLNPESGETWYAREVDGGEVEWIKIGNTP